MGSKQGVSVRALRSRTIAVATAAGLVASLLGVVVPPAALASVTVTSAGTVPLGGISASSATFSFAEYKAGAFTGAGSLVVTITDSAGGSTVHFVGRPGIAAPASLGASVGVNASGTSFTVATSGQDPATVESVSISGLQIAADAGAATGAIQATLAGSLKSAVDPSTTKARGTIGLPITDDPIVVPVVLTSPCNFAVTDNLNEGLNGRVDFADQGDPRTVLAVLGGPNADEALSLSQGQLPHPAGTIVTQLVASCGPLPITSPGTVAAPVATRLAFLTQPGGGTGGAAWSTQPVVAVEDASGNVVTSSSAIVTLAILNNPGAGVLTCFGGLSVQASAGLATFAGCSITKAAASYTLIATSSGLTSATSQAFNVTVGPPARLRFLRYPASPTPRTFAPQPAVALVDAGDNLATSASATISLALASGSGKLSCGRGLSVATVGGVATFEGCRVNRAGVYALRADDGAGGLAPIVGSAFTVTTR